MECALNFFRTVRAIAEDNSKQGEYLWALRELFFEHEIYQGRAEKDHYNQSVQWWMGTHKNLGNLPKEIKNDLKFFSEEHEWGLPKETNKQRQLQTGGKKMYRPRMFAHEYKVKAGLANPKDAGDWDAEFGESARQAWYSTDKYNPRYRPPTKPDFRKIIGLLDGVPEAQKLAQTDLDNL